MARVLLIHHDDIVLRSLASALQKQHEFAAINNLVKGVKSITKLNPDVIIVGHDRKKKEGARLLHFLRENTVRIPVIVVVSAGGGVAQPLLMKLGAKGLLEYPVSEHEINQAIESALKSRAAELEGPRPITQEELNSNLSVLESTLNRDMKCFAGKNQVYIQSTILGAGVRTRPRIALRCSLRAEFGLDRDVYYEYIRDICCGDPEQCEAVQRFKAGRESA